MNASNPKPLITVYWTENGEQKKQDYYEMTGTAGAEAAILRLKQNGAYFHWVEHFPKQDQAYGTDCRGGCDI